MLFKIITLIAAAVPVVLFLRAMFFRRPTRFSGRLKDVKKEIDFAIWVFLGLVGCTVVFALGRLIWAWWVPV